VGTEKAQPVRAEPAPQPARSGAISIGKGSCLLRVESEPSGGAVMIDGQPAGTTPVDIKGLLCGRTVNIVIGKELFDIWQRRTTTREGEVAHLAATLRRPRTLLSIHSTPPGATVFLNAKEIGTTPLIAPVSAFVKSTVEVRKAGYNTARETILSQLGTSNRVRVTLEALAPREGRLP
jgi:hypothetical protein